MKSVKLKYFIILVAVCATIVSSMEPMGKKGKAIIHEASICKVDRKDDKSSIIVRDITETKRAANFTLEFPVDMDDKQLSVTVTVDKLVGGIWQKDFMTFTGPACAKSLEYFPGMVKKISSMSSPKLDPKCPWKKGAYTVQNYPVLIQADETALPSYPYGRLRLNFKIMDKKKKVLMCLNIEADVQKP